MAYQFQTFTPATNRTGIPDSVRTAIDRHIAGETATAIVAPPRYGKSDIIRLTALELTELGNASAALALVPWVNLADQLTDVEKTSLMIKRYFKDRAPRTPDNFRAGRIGTITDSFHETKSLQHLFTATIQLVNNSLPMFRAWIRKCKAYGARPVIFIDEGHLLSHKNEWGKIAAIVHEEGAHLILLTGTPYRADRENIPGFKIENLSPVEHFKNVMHRRVDENHVSKQTRNVAKQKRILVANETTSLRDAWNVGALCKVETKWIDVDITIENETSKISELNAADSCKHLRKVVTDDGVIAESMRVAIKDMEERRQAGMGNSGILVISVSDINDEGVQVSDGKANYHARKIQRAIKLINPDLQVDIATQAGDEDKKGRTALNKLNKFARGEGDILIVKNMGTVGLDSPRIKTVVNLGTARQIAVWIQSALRGGTTVPGKNIAYFTLVLTDDFKNRENWEFTIGGEGGEYFATESELESEVIIEDPKHDDEIHIELSNASHTLTGDSHAEEEISDETKAHILIAANPSLRDKYSIVELIENIKNGLYNPSLFTAEKTKDAPTVGVIDTGDECIKLRAIINETIRKIVNKRVPYAQNKALWVSQQTLIMAEVKRYAGVNCELKVETDTSKLQMMRDACERIVANG